MSIAHWMDLARARHRGASKVCAVSRAVLSRLARLEAAAGTKLGMWADVSYHSAFDRCAGVEVSRVPIEPLAGFLRHPNFMLQYCKDRTTWELVEHKQHLLPTHRCELQPPEVARKACRFLLFDLGASLWSKGKGGSSQDWFIEAYRRQNISFDKIFAWEPTPHTEEEIGANVPPAVREVLHYFNVAVDPAPGAQNNPLRLLREVACADDFVVFKVDVDAITVEATLIEQILADNALSGLIDELYFEDHVVDSPMVEKGWDITLREPHNRRAKPRLLSESYRLFQLLRMRGIRAHSWV